MPGLNAVREWAIRDLGPRDMPAVAELEAATFPPLHQWGYEKLYEFLAVPYVQGRNFSYGAFVHGRMVAYMLAAVQPSIVRPGEAVVYLKSSAVLPEFRARVGVPIWARLAREALACGYALEGKARQSTTFALLERHPRVLQRWGVQVTVLGQVEEVDGEPLLLMRGEPAAGVDTPVYRLAARWRRLGRSLPLLPLRALRRVCYHLPRAWLPRPLARLTLLSPT